MTTEAHRASFATFPAANAADGSPPGFGFRVRTTPDGRVTIDGQPVDTTGYPTPQAAAVEWVARRARTDGCPQQVTATDPAGRDFRLLVHPDGHSELEPTTTEPTTAADRDPAGVGRLAKDAKGDPADDPRVSPGQRLRRSEPTPTGAVPRLHPAAAPADTQAPAAPVPALRPAGLLPRLRPTTARPTVGWQARVHSWTGGRIAPAVSRAETRHRDLVAAVQGRLDGPALIAVVNPKGGAGKTPAVLCTAATFGAHRGSVVAWDDNETRGTLAMRALADPADPTVRGLLADLVRFEDPHARVGDLAAYLRPQGGARFDVLASDDDPARMAQFGAAEFTRVRDVLARFYGVTVVDTGNNVRAGNWQAAVDAADQLLLVSTYQRDAAVTASWTLDHLHATGRGRLADTAVTVLSAATPSTDRRTRVELRDHFTARTRAVVEIPYDPVIADGEHLDLHALRPATREAWLEATAALTEKLTR